MSDVSVISTLPPSMMCTHMHTHSSTLYPRNYIYIYIICFAKYVLLPSCAALDIAGISKKGLHRPKSILRTTPFARAAGFIGNLFALRGT